MLGCDKGSQLLILWIIWRKQDVSYTFVQTNWKRGDRLVLGKRGTELGWQAGIGRMHLDWGLKIQPGLGYQGWRVAGWGRLVMLRCAVREILGLHSTCNGCYSNTKITKYNEMHCVTEF